MAGDGSAAPAPVPAAWAVYVGIALSGATALSSEVIWTRLLSLLFGGTVYTFALILSVFLFGLGIGSTKVGTSVRVQNLPASNPPFLTFTTYGTSGATPGAATNPIPFSSAATALFQSQQGISDDSNRTARMITARIANYMSERGWPLIGPAPKIKTAR